MPDLLERLTSALAGRYAVESEIGRGGMAVVFLADARESDGLHRRNPYRSARVQPANA